MTIDIQVKGLRKLQKQLDPKTAEKGLKLAMHGAAQAVLADLREYPEKPSAGDKARAVAAWTPKQRAWFFWALRHGEIEVPYRRGQSPGSEKLGASQSALVKADSDRSWTIKVRRVTGAIEAIVGTNVSYARYVLDAKKQAVIHRGRWQTVQQIQVNKARDVRRLVEAAIQKWIRMKR